MYFFRIWTIKAIEADVGAKLPRWQRTALTAVSNLAMLASYHRTIEFFEDTVGLEGMAAMVGKSSYLNFINAFKPKSLR